MEIQSVMLLVFIIIAYGVWGFLIKFSIEKIGIWSAATIGFATSIAMGAIVLTYTLSRGGQFVLNTTSIILSLGVVLSTLGVLATYILLEKKYVSMILPLTELYLVIVVLLGIFVLGEKLTLTQLAGIGFAIAAVFLLSV